MTAPAPNSRPAAGLYFPAAPGLLRLTGRDRISFLQRQSTNNLLLLTPQTTLVSVLTSATARILDVLHLWLQPEAGEEALYALTMPEKAAASVRFLKSRIFFMDQLQVQDLSPVYLRCELDGPAAGWVLSQAGLGELPAPGAWRAFEYAGQPAWLLARPGWAGAGCTLLASASAQAALSQALQSAGAALLDVAGYDILRIEAGLPGPLEQSEAYTPLEAGLGRYVADNKGCYTGQEIIARQITYDKITRRLAGLRLSQAAPVGATVEAEGRSIGEITSSAVSPRLGPLALAVLKRPFFEPGSQVQVAGQTAAVCALPFEQ